MFSKMDYVLLTSKHWQNFIIIFNMCDPAQEKDAPSWGFIMLLRYF